MFNTLKNRIRFAVLIIVLLFTCFTLFYFPKQEGNYLLKSYNEQVQNFANTVALGVRIALDEDNYEGIRTAMEYLKGQPDLKYVSLVQNDTAWNDTHTQYKISAKIFKTFPEDAHPSLSDSNSNLLIVKRSDFTTDLMAGTIVLAFSTHSIAESQKQIRMAALLISAVILFVGMLISFWLSKSISRPVKALSDAARKVGSGDLSAVITHYSNDEIGSFIKVFNTMVSDLAAARKELNNANQSLSDTNQTLNTALNNLKATQAQLIQSEKMASLGELTAGIAHEIQNPLNFINNFSEVNNELIDELREEHLKPDAERDEQNEEQILRDIRQNLEKISTHGKRADDIVKGMLQHSRATSGEKEPTDINAFCDEYLRLSYHGLRAKDKSFNADFKTDFDETIGKINVIPQDIGRVLLNLFNNAFYAVNDKLKAEGLRLSAESSRYIPIVSVATKKLNNRVEITVSDNGNGIPDTVKDKIFQPFFTTKPAGKGTGLGLSLSYDIIRAHRGEIKVETTQGVGSTFIISLPVR